MMHAHAPLAPKTAPTVKVGRAQDAEERDADRIAQRLMAPARIGCTACAAGDQPCAACASGAAKLRRRALGPAPASVPVPMLRGAGTPMPAALRSRFEDRLGTDLSAIRLHRGGDAAHAARSVGAHAFALGRDIAFGQSAPPLDTRGGEELLAHEVAHTVQDGAARTIRRRSDFDIIGIHPDAASDPGTIYFDYNSSVIDPAEQPKVAPLAAPPAQPLTLFGYSSEEGGAGNAGLISQRITRVSGALRAAGHAAVRDPKPEPAASAGQIDYRRYRAVSVVPTPPVGGGPAAPPLGGGGAPCVAAVPCGGAFAAAFPIAVTQLVTAIAHVAASTAQAQAELATMFPGIPAPTVLTGLTGLATEISRMPNPANHRCHDFPCDAGCDRPAYADPGARVMTLCPGFLNNPTPAQNAITLLHEGLHMVPGLTTVDTAYRNSRMIDFIGGPAAVTNTDSYVVLILRLAGAAAGGPPADPLGSLAPAEQTAAKRSLAFVEQWLLNADWDTSLLFEAIEANKGRAGGWDPAVNYAAGFQHAIAATFGLTDPGPAAPYLITPTDNDQWVVAGVHDRYNRMMQAVWMTPITVTASAAGPEAWAAPLGNAVTVTPAFFALGPSDQVLRMLELMAASLPPADIPVARQRDYAVGAQQLWIEAGRTGP